MNDAQKWLENNYPSQRVSKLRRLRDGSPNTNFNKKRSEITHLKIEAEGLFLTEGPLKLEGFDNLRELNCISNKITSLEITNCPNLEKIICSRNQLAELNLQDFPKLKTLICNDNKLTSLNLSNNKELENLNIMDNSFAEQNLSLLGNLTKLKELRLGNENSKRINEQLYNRFHDSLEPLKNISGLKLLDIRNTNVSGGLEHLPESIDLFNCLADIRKDAQVKKIYDLFANEQGEVELLTEPNKGFIKDFSAKLRVYKQKIAEGVDKNKDDKDKKIQQLKDKVSELGQQLEKAENKKQSDKQEIDNLKDQLKTANETIKDLKGKLSSTDQAEIEKLKRENKELEDSLRENRKLTNTLKANSEKMIKNLKATIAELKSQGKQPDNLDEIIKKAKDAKSINELKSSIDSLNFYRDSQVQEIKKTYEQSKKKIDQLHDLLEFKLQLTRHLEEAIDVSQDSKDEQEEIFEERRLARLNLENFAELVSSEAKQAYQEINEDGKVTNCIEKLAKKLWDHLEGYEKRANHPLNKEFLQALTDRGITEGTSRYKLFWLVQGIAKEFAKTHLDGKIIDVYPYVEVPSGGHTNWKGRRIGTEGFDLNLEFVKEGELRIPISLAHELSHDVVKLKEWKGTVPFEQIHSKTFWEGLFVDSDSTFNYLISCLPSERQKELRATTDLLNNSWVNDAHIAYFPNTDDLGGKRRLKKYFKDEDINREWSSIRQEILSLVDNSMNEGDKIKKWKDMSELNRRWIWAESLHKLQLPKQGDRNRKQEHKVYIFYDQENVLKDQIEREFSSAKGWINLAEEKGEEIISTHRAETIASRIGKLGGCFKCGCGEENISEEVPQQEAKIVEQPFKKD